MPPYQRLNGLPDREPSPIYPPILPFQIGSCACGRGSSGTEPELWGGNSGGEFGDGARTLDLGKPGMGRSPDALAGSRRRETRPRGNVCGDAVGQPRVCGRAGAKIRSPIDASQPRSTTKDHGCVALNRRKAGFGLRPRTRTRSPNSVPELGRPRTRSAELGP